MHVPLLGGATAAVPSDETLIGELLEKARPGAYHKAMVGKWDLGAASPKYIPTARGFDGFTGFYNAMIDYFDWTIEGAVSDIAGTVVDAQRNDGPAAKAAGQYTTRFLRDAALGEVAAAKAAGKALFLYAVRFAASVFLRKGCFPISFFPSREAGYPAACTLRAANAGLERDPLRRGDPRRARAGPARVYEGPGARTDGN